MTELNAFKLILQAGPVVKFVMLILIAMSIVSWGIIFLKVRTIRKSLALNKQFLDLFYEPNSPDLLLKSARLLVASPVAQLYLQGTNELKKNNTNMTGLNVSNRIIDNLERSLSREMTLQIEKLESRLPFLATTGSGAPFIGLFGTVWGIMNSFLSIGAKGATSLAVVAPGISEALIATAIGLFAAIPAVVGYNYCQSKIKSISRHMTSFANDFINITKRSLDEL